MPIPTRFAFYSLIIVVVYIIGLPLTVFVILFRRRHKLFGDPADPFVATARSTYGFLYEAYGPSAWWWEVEELVRKLLLSAVVVLVESGSPLQVRVDASPDAVANVSVTRHRDTWVLYRYCLLSQVTLAVLVSGWAHVLHAVYKPWGEGSHMYMLQHGSLFVTSFVFLMVRPAPSCSFRQFRYPFRHCCPRC